MKYSKIDIQSVESAADIRDIVPDLKGKGAQRYCTCPQCGKSGKNKGLLVWHKKKGNDYINGGKCYSCGFSLSGAINAYMHFNNVDFIPALDDLARQYNVNISAIESGSVKSEKEDRHRGSFCEMQLYNSGLTFEDVMVRVPIKGTDNFKFESPFRKGGADRGLRFFNETDDEMLIHYYDLDGNPLKFSEKGGRGSLRNYIRVRWSNPALHKDQHGKDTKYQTMKGAPCFFYITEYIRSAYRNSDHIETLVIQEGEKKAEKACKHGIPSLGIQGIYNIGNAESGLIKELQYIVRKCTVKNIVLMMDADWDHLSRNLEPGCRVDQRPNQFAKAVIKFKQYIKTLHQLGLFVDIYFGHIKDNEAGDKGIDDLLHNTLFMREKELKEDFDKTLLSHDGKGKYVNIYKISAKTDNQIFDFWHLNSRDEFFNKYKNQLTELVSFRFGGISYVVDNGKFVEAAREAETNFWSVKSKINETTGEKKKTIDFDYLEGINFLEANSFFRIHTVDQKIGEYRFIKSDDFIVREISATHIRNFVLDYVRRITKDSFVIGAFISRLKSWLGSDVLESLKEIEDNFYFSEPLSQSFFFSNCKVDITADDIQTSQIAEFVWKDNQIDRKFTRIPIMEFYQDDSKNNSFRFTEAGLRSDFVQFIICTSNFWKDNEDKMTPDEKADMCTHLLNKITAIGYLLNSWKPRSEQICIVAMDAKMDEVGASNGRSGKSFIGQALKHMINVQSIDCKKIKNDDDFIYSLVTPKTRIVFLDDIRVNFDFENFYSALTDDLQINPKQGGRFELKYDKAPKFYITTNHALNDQSDSGKDRRVMMAFSNFFNTKYSPAIHFGHLLFEDWDEEQWNLFDNFMIECVMIYLRSFQEEWHRKGRGVIPPPMNKLEQRAMRQCMGETFLMWAEAMFDINGSRINCMFQRKELMNDYHKEFPSAREQIRPQDFRKRMIAFCNYKGYHFNPNGKTEDGIRFSEWCDSHPGETFVGQSYKSNSVEYWTIASDEYARSQPW